MTAPLPMRAPKWSHRMVRRLVRLALRRYRRNGLGAVSVPRLTDAVRAAIGWDVPESWILDAARGCPDNLGVLTRRGVPHCCRLGSSRRKRGKGRKTTARTS